MGMVTIATSNMDYNDIDQWDVYAIYAETDRKKVIKKICTEIKSFCPDDRVQYDDHKIVHTMEGGYTETIRIDVMSINE